VIVGESTWQVIKAKKSTQSRMEKYVQNNY